MVGLPSIVDSVEATSKCREVSLFQRLICTQKYTIGTSETVLIREVSFKRGFTAVCNFVHITDLTQCVLPGLEATVVVICL